MIKKLLSLGILGICMTLPVSSAAQIVSGTSFNLLEGGDVTAQLTTSAEGTPTLFFFDDRDVPRISIGLYEDGAPGIVLNDDQGQAAALLRLVESNGDPVLVLKEDGRDRVIIRGETNISQNETGLTDWFLFLSLAMLSGFLGSYVFHIRNMQLMS